MDRLPPPPPEELSPGTDQKSKTEEPDPIRDHHGSLPIIERREGNRRGKTARMQFQRHTGVEFIAEGVSRGGKEGMQQQAKEKGWQPCRWRDVRGGHVIGLHIGCGYDKNTTHGR